MANQRASHPLAGRPPPNKGKTYPAEILTPDEFRAILAQIPTHTWLGLRNRALITVLYRAGLRISEALVLRPHHVDLETGVIQVLHGKGDKRRTVGIDPGACAVVAEWLTVRNTRPIPPGAPLFPSGTGRPVSQSCGPCSRTWRSGLASTSGSTLTACVTPMPMSS